MPENPKPPKTKRCPFCAEEILAAVIKCKHCQSVLDGAPVPHQPVAGQTTGIGTPSEHLDVPALPTGSVICRACGYCGRGRKIDGVQALLVVVLLLFFIIPGIAYLIYLGYWKGSCPTCGKHEVIPANSETGRALIAVRNDGGTDASAAPALPTGSPSHGCLWALIVPMVLIVILWIVGFCRRAPQAANDGGTNTSTESTPAAGYVVFMRDGARIRTKGPYKVQANVAVLTLEDGTLSYVSLDLIEGQATDAPSSAKAPDSETPKTVVPTPAPEAAREARERLARQKVLDGLSNSRNPTQADIDVLRRNAIRNNVTMDGQHRLEQLVYPNDVYIYLRDGRLELISARDEEEAARLRFIREDRHRELRK